MSFRWLQIVTVFEPPNGEYIPEYMKRVRHEKPILQRKIKGKWVTVPTVREERKVKVKR